MYKSLLVVVFIVIAQADCVPGLSLECFRPKNIMQQVLGIIMSLYGKLIESGKRSSTDNFVANLSSLLPPGFSENIEKLLEPVGGLSGLFNEISLIHPSFRSFAPKFHNSSNPIVDA